MIDLIKDLEWWLVGIRDHGFIPDNHPLPRAIAKLKAAEELARVAEAMALDLRTLAKENADEWGEPLHEHTYFSQTEYDRLIEGHQERSSVMEETETLLTEMKQLMGDD